MATSNLPTIDKFNCEGDAASLTLRWLQWKRALNIYLTASNIDSLETKKAILLHSGRIGLQDIFYRIRELQESGNATDNIVYDISIKKLDNYFSPRKNLLYERHLFRLLRQENGEKFNQFILRLRNQAEKCYFTNSNEHIIDQVIEKCQMTELRRKLLIMNYDEINLNNIIMEANILEAVDQQLQSENKKNVSGAEVINIKVMT